MTLLLGVALAAVGGVVAFAGTRVAARGGEAPVAFLLDMDGGGSADLYEQQLRTSLWSRLVVPLRQGLVARVVQLTPRARLDKVHALLLQAGLANTIRAEEVLAAQLLAGGAGVVSAV